mmetsp:Transcript_70131/g.131103  ORF Transcript_70131/g.131103 Transcript_70131/m.131103 type:complete len:531 (-) Transcript_70131:193-1785(-)
MEPMTAKKSIAFPDLRRLSLVRKASSIADDTVEGKVGVKIGDFVAGIFAANSLTGIGVLTVPYAFKEAGWLLGITTLLVCMFMAFITGTYIIEAEAIANAMHYAEGVGTLAEDLLPKLKDECKQQDADPNDAVRLFQGASIKSNSESAFKIRDRIEVGTIGERLLTNSVARILVYVAIICFIYGSLSAFVVTVNTSLSHTLASMLQGGCKSFQCPWKGNASVDQLYPLCLMATFLLAFKLCLGDLQKTKKFTVMVMAIRFIAMGIMLVGTASIIGDRGYAQEPGTPEQPDMTLSEAFEELPRWNFGSLGFIFGNSVYVFTLHHALPSMIAPLEHQDDAPKVLISSFLVVVFLMVLLSVSAMLAFQEVQSFYNLNFTHTLASIWTVFDIGSAVGLFIVAYPTFAISTIPTNAITLRNTLGRVLHFPPPDPDNNLTPSNLFLTALVLVPPFFVAYVTDSIQVIIKFVGGYFGLTVSFLLPLVLVICGRRRLTELTHKSHFAWHLKSPYGNPLVYAVVLIFYVLAILRQMLYN